MLVTTLDSLRGLIDRCIEAKILGLDCETRPRDGIAYSGLDVRPYEGVYEDTRSRLAGVCLAYDQEHGHYVPLQHDTGNIDADPRDVIVEFHRLGAALVEKRVLACTWNSGFDLALLRRVLGARRLPVGAWIDGMIVDQFLRPHSFTHDLKSTARRVLKAEMTDFEAPLREVWAPELDVDHRLHVARRNTAMDFGALDPRDADEYASRDAYMTLRYVVAVMNKELPARTHQLVALEHDFALAVASMQRAQIGYDRAGAVAMADEFLAALDFIESVLRDLGLENPNSPPQVLAFLRRFGFTGTCTDKVALAAVRSEELRAAAVLIAEHRRVAKYIGAYIAPLLNADHPSEVMGSWRAWGAKSGRMSAGTAKGRRKDDVHVWSSWLPHGQPRDERMRALYCARPGFVLITADYSSQEYRVVAELAGEPSWIATFNDPNPVKQDVHAATARLIFPGFDGFSKERKKELRNTAKTVNFASIYGAQAPKIAEMLGVVEHEAQAILDRLYTGAPALRTFIDESQREAAQYGRVYTWFGRPVSVRPKDTTDGDDLVVHAAPNYRVQGTCADILRLAVTEFSRREAGSLWCQGGDDSVRIVNLVHDEVVVEACEDDAERVAAVLRECMEGVVPASWRTRLPTEQKIASHWSK